MENEADPRPEPDAVGIECAGDMMPSALSPHIHQSPHWRCTCRYTSGSSAVTTELRLTCCCVTSLQSWFSRNFKVDIAAAKDRNPMARTILEWTLFNKVPFFIPVAT